MKISVPFPHFNKLGGKERMKFAVSVGMLGYTRINNLCVYDSETRGFEDLTPACARKEIDLGLIKGVKWRNTEEDGPEFYCDEAGFNQKDIMVKSANKFRPLVNDVVGSQTNNSMYTVVRILDTPHRGRLYEVVSNKYQRVKIDEAALRKLDSLTSVAGVVILDDDITSCDGVIYEDRTQKMSAFDEIFGKEEKDTKPSLVNFESENINKQKEEEPKEEQKEQEEKQESANLEDDTADMAQQVESEKEVLPAKSEQSPAAGKSKSANKRNKSKK